MRSSDWSSDVCSSDLNAVWQMKEDIVPNGGWKFDHLLAYRQAEVAHTAPLAKDARFPIFPPYAVQQIRDAMPDDGIICLDNGVYKIWFARGYTAYKPNRSEERRVGKAGVSTRRSRWSPDHKKTQNKQQTDHTHL